MRAPTLHTISPTRSVKHRRRTRRSTSFSRTRARDEIGRPILNRIRVIRVIRG
jgi:hypothetical protein